MRDTGGEILRLAKFPREFFDDVKGQTRILGQKGEKGVLVDTTDRGVLDHLGRSGIRLVREQGPVPQEVARAGDPDDLLAPVDAGLEDFHPAGKDAVQSKRLVPLVKNDLPLLILIGRLVLIALFQPLLIEVAKNPKETGAAGLAVQFGRFRHLNNITIIVPDPQGVMRNAYSLEI
jgi:hypothetical protein